MWIIFLPVLQIVSLMFTLWWTWWQQAEERTLSLLFSCGKASQGKDGRRSLESILDCFFLHHGNFIQSAPPPPTPSGSPCQWCWGVLVQIIVLGINRLTVWQGQVVWSASSVSSSLSGTAPWLWSGCLPHIHSDLGLSADGTLPWQTATMQVLQWINDSSVSKYAFLLTITEFHDKEK